MFTNYPRALQGVFCFQYSTISLSDVSHARGLMAEMAKKRRKVARSPDRVKSNLLFIYLHNHVEMGGNSAFQILCKEFPGERSSQYAGEQAPLKCSAIGDGLSREAAGKQIRIGETSVIGSAYYDVVRVRFTADVLTNSS